METIRQGGLQKLYELGIRSVYSKMGRLGRGVCIRQKENAALRASERPFLRTFFHKYPESLKSVFFLRKMPCGNDMIDAHVENLMDSKADHRFATVAWTPKAFGAHNHLDKCFALTHISHKADYY